MELGEHFYHLKVKYKATSYQNDQLLNPLYFILRKAENYEELSTYDLQWLENKNLLQTIETIKNNKLPKISYPIVDELKSILMKFPFIRIVELPGTEVSEILLKSAITIYRINANEILNHDEILAANLQRGFYIDGKAYKAYVINVQFDKIKRKYGLSDNLLFNEKLYVILKKLEAPEQLSTNDIQFLIDHGFIDSLTLLKNDFVRLQDKYKAIKEEPAVKIQLYPILKKIDENRVLSPDEFDWLKTQNYVETTTIARQIEFVVLKRKFSADEIEEKTLPHHLYTILVKIDSNKAISEADINYLRKRKLFITISLALKLYSKFEIEPVLKNQLCEILYKLEIGERLHDADVVWLTSEKWFQDKSLFSKSRIYQRHHSLEAIFCEQEYKRTKGMWHLVNASSHWRKAEYPEKALKNTEVLFSDLIKEVKLKAALLTTRGGALRDIGKLDEAEEFAHQAIKLYQKSYHPYTLLGAICFQTGRYDDGEYWFNEARKRGAPEKSEISEIIGILRKPKDKQEQEKFLAFLKDKYPDHFDRFKAIINSHSNKK